MAYITSLRLYQVGIQSAFGTAVAATAKIWAESLTVTPLGIMNRPDVADGGVIAAHSGTEFVTRRGVQWTLRGPLAYEQLQTFLLAGIDGSVTGSGTAPTVWTFTQAFGTINTAPKYLTIERRFSDGTTPDDFEMADCFVTQIRISKGADERLDMEISGFGRIDADSTLTSSQALPTNESIPYALSTVSQDSSWANLGNTALSLQVLDWSFTYNTGLFPRYTADGRSNLDYNDRGGPVRPSWNITLRLRAGTNFATEKAAALAATLRAIEIATAGTNSRALTISALVKHEGPEITEMETDEGEDVFSVNYVTATDGTNGASIVVSTVVAADDGVA